uniref:YbbR-like domain-containing protein n=1 Tax=Prevotella sp. GTC17254 TaxID=3236794 RepID=A0AB33IV99_9BACT
MLKAMRQIYQKTRNFLFSLVNREFLVFLFFLALSGGFWLLTSLNETYEAEVAVPVRLVGVPRNVVITNDMTDTVRVMVRDKGFTIATYLHSDRIRPLVFNFSAYANTAAGKGAISASDLQKQLYPMLYGSTRMTSLKPDRLSFFFNYGESKKVPVRLHGNIKAGKSYYLAQTRFWPEYVTVYASRQILDSIQSVYTVPVTHTHLQDTLIERVALRHIQGAKCIPAVVKVGFYPDILTEETVSVPIEAVNMPAGKILRTFPSRVNVIFTVGASMFRRIGPEQFRVVADYNDIVSQHTDKCPLHLRVYPHGVRGVKLEISQIDYLIEQQ